MRALVKDTVFVSPTCPAHGPSISTRLKPSSCVQRLQEKDVATVTFDAVVVVVDAASPRRGLHLALEVLSQSGGDGKPLPCVIALNMIDQARRKGIDVDPKRLSQWLGCNVVLTSARRGEGISELAQAARTARPSTTDPPAQDDREALNAWIDGVIRDSAPRSLVHQQDKLAERMDRAFTHPLLGVVLFAIVMAGAFVPWTIFAFASCADGIY